MALVPRVTSTNLWQRERERELGLFTWAPTRPSRSLGRSVCDHALFDQGSWCCSPVSKALSELSLPPANFRIFHGKSLWLADESWHDISIPRKRTEKGKVETNKWNKYQTTTNQVTNHCTYKLIYSGTAKSQFVASKGPHVRQEVPVYTHTPRARWQSASSCYAIIKSIVDFEQSGARCHSKSGR